MTNKLAARREALVARSRTERATIMDAAQPLLRQAAAVDRTLMRVRRHPVIVTLLGAAVVFFGSRKLFDIASRVLTIYALFRR